MYVAICINVGHLSKGLYRPRHIYLYYLPTNNCCMARLENSLYTYT